MSSLRQPSLAQSTKLSNGQLVITAALLGHRAAIFDLYQLGATTLSFFTTTAALDGNALQLTADS